MWCRILHACVKDEIREGLGAREGLNPSHVRGRIGCVTDWEPHPVGVRSPCALPLCAAHAPLPVPPPSEPGEWGSAAAPRHPSSATAVGFGGGVPRPVRRPEPGEGRRHRCGDRCRGRCGGSDPVNLVAEPGTVVPGSRIEGSSRSKARPLRPPPSSHPPPLPRPCSHHGLPIQNVEEPEVYTSAAGEPNASGVSAGVERRHPHMKEAAGGRVILRSGTRGSWPSGRGRRRLFDGLMSWVVRLAPSASCKP
jgi:hypothetical protein